MPANEKNEQEVVLLNIGAKFSLGGRKGYGRKYKKKPRRRRKRRYLDFDTPKLIENNKEFQKQVN